MKANLCSFSTESLRLLLLLLSPGACTEMGEEEENGGDAEENYYKIEEDFIRNESMKGGRKEESLQTSFKVTGILQVVGRRRGGGGAQLCVVSMAA